MNDIDLLWEISWRCRLINCFRREAIIVNVCLFYGKFLVDRFDFPVTFTPLTFCVSRDLKFSLNHNFKQLN